MRSVETRTSTSEHTAAGTAPKQLPKINAFACTVGVYLSRQDAAQEILKNTRVTTVY